MEEDPRNQYINAKVYDDALIAAENLGVAKTRKMYDEAIFESGISDSRVRELCLEYAELEKNLQELDRARELYILGSERSNPETDLDYWAKWSDFEHHFGNADTIREMLRIKRCLARSYQHHGQPFPPECF